jgi:hypothetical protein
MDGAPGPRRGADENRALHARLLQRDPTATADLADREIGPLAVGPRQRFARHRFPVVDDALLESAAIDLILQLGEEPEKYDPDHLPLHAYLLMAAGRDVQTALRREANRQRRQIPLESVGLSPPGRNSEVSGANPTADPADRTLEALERAHLERLFEELRGTGREIMQSVVDDERRGR